MKYFFYLRFCRLLFTVCNWSFFSLNALSCDASHGRGFCGAGGSSSRPSAGSHKQCGPSVHTHGSHSNRNSADVDNVRAKNSSSTSSRTSAQSASKASTLVLDSNAVAQAHTAGRKSKGPKQSQHSSQQHVHSTLEQHSPSPPAPPAPPVPHHQQNYTQKC